MRLVTSIYTMEQLNSLSNVLDYALLMSKDASLNYSDLDLKKAISFCKDKGIGIILSMDKIYQPSTITFAEAFLEEYKDLCEYFYVTDLGVCNLALKKGMIDRVIYDPKTMITNSLDLKLYADFGFNAVGISSEMTLNDAKEMTKKTNKNVFYHVFGYRLMFYSRRHLISLYSKKNNSDYPKLDVYFKEATRNDYFPGFENDNGTVMYRSYVISMLEYLEDLRDMKYGFLESYRIEDKKMKQVLKLYQKVINGTPNVQECIAMFNKLGLYEEEGFIKKDSVYQKEELKS